METALQRLEQVTARLEKLESNLSRSGAAAAPGASRVPASTPSAPAASDQQLSASVLTDYQTLLAAALEPLVSSSSALSEEVQNATRIVSKAFSCLGDLITTASRARQPSPAELQALVQPLGEQLMEANGLVEGRRGPAFNHFKVTAESLQGLCFVLYAGPGTGMSSPPDHVQEAWQAAEFFANKILMEFRGKDDLQVGWVRSFKDLMVGLRAYVGKHHSKGLSWNPNGVPVAEAQAQGPGSRPTASSRATAAPATASTAAASRPRGPPPPPPPAPPVGSLIQDAVAKAAANASKAAAAGVGLSGLLGALNQGEGVTRGLRKVTDDMKAKNRADRTGAVPGSSGPGKPAQAAAAGGGAGATGATAPRGPPRLVLEDDRKWIVENQLEARELGITATEPKHAVYIYNCRDTVVQITGRVKTISIDRCSRTGVVFHDVIAQVEIVNCQSLQVQCTGATTSIAIDKTDDCQLYVTHELAASQDFQIVTSKTSALNVLVAAATADGDSQEHPVPEQFVSSFKGGKLLTVPAAHAGA